MSWRIAIEQAANTGAADFTIGVDGTIDECIAQSWSEGPIKVYFTDPAALRVFISVWVSHRRIDDVWAFYHVANGEAKAFGEDHPTADEFLAALDQFPEEVTL